jgi:hypothetical protein
MRIGRCSIRLALACAVIVSVAVIEFAFPSSPVLSAPPGPRPGMTPLVKPTAVPLVQPTDVPPSATPTATLRPRPRATATPQLPEPPQPAGSVVPPAPPAQPGSVLAPLAGHLAFEVYKPGMSKPTYDIYISRPDGSDRRLLWEWGRQPRFRRGDGRIVLNGDGQGKDNLWTLNPDGSAARESSLHPEDAHPSWSPDGQRLLFDSEFYTWGAAGDRIWTIWVQNSVDKGSEPVSVSVAGRVVPGRAPLWLDNDWIVYTGCNFWAGAGSCGLYTAPSWGGDRARQLTTGADDIAGDVLGNRIVYASRLDGNWEIYTVNFDGGGKANLTNNPANDGLPAFSPDGRNVAFVSDRSGAWAIWVMNGDGSNQRKLFDLPGAMGDDWVGERISWGP